MTENVVQADKKLVEKVKLQIRHDVCSKDGSGEIVWRRFQLRQIQIRSGLKSEFLSYQSERKLNYNGLKRTFNKESVVHSTLHFTVRLRCIQKNGRE